VVSTDGNSHDLSVETCLGCGIWGRHWSAVQEGKGVVV
jgi:hypothetical protein